MKTLSLYQDDGKPGIIAEGVVIARNSPCYDDCYDCDSDSDHAGA
jgi:hypothetical protein